MRRLTIFTVLLAMLINQN